MNDAVAKNAASTSVGATTEGASDERCLTPAELAHFLQVGKGVVERRVRSGEWPAHRVGRRVRFTAEDVAAIEGLTQMNAAAVANPWGLTDRSRQRNSA